MRPFLIITLFLFSISLIFAGSLPSKKKDPKDYIAKLDNSFELNGEYQVDFTHIAMINDQGNRMFTYYPNMRGVINLGIRYKFLFFNYSFNVKENDTYNRLYGKTTFNQFAFGIKTRPIWLILYYSKHQGFFISEENLLFPTFGTDSLYTQNNTLATKRLGIRLDIIFSKKFSMEAAFEYSKIQKKSAGSFMLRLNPEFSGFNAAENPIIPLEYLSHFGGLQYFYKTNFYNFGMGLGYAYSLVIGPINFSNMALIGPTFQLYAYDKLSVAFPLLMNFKSSLSFNVKNFYVGALASLDVQNYKLLDNTIRKQSLAFILRAGLRF
ncbi:MAG: hypothetical protein H6Q25_146 [Bacteroidetes bacterium]|nr:hypothetical protein [Bacteroidota bacterium]